MFKQKLISISFQNSNPVDTLTNKTIRELEKDIETMSKKITELEKNITRLFETPNNYNDSFFETITPLIKSEAELKEKIKEQIEIRDIKIKQLLDQFNLNDKKENLDDFISKMRNQIDKKQTLKFKKAKIDGVYDAIKNLKETETTEQKAQCILTSIETFLQNTKKSNSEEESDTTKLNLILAFQEKVRSYLPTPIKSQTSSDSSDSSDNSDTRISPRNTPRKMERTPTQKIMDISNTLPQKTNARRKSADTINNVLARTFSNEINIPTEIIGEKLKKALILQNLENIENNQDILKNAFERIDSEFISAINLVRPTVINVEPNKPIELKTASGNSYSLGKKIGGGSNGTIWEVIHDDLNENLVAKKVYVGLFGMEIGLGVQSPEQVFKELNMIYELGIIQNNKDHLISYKDFFILINNQNETVELISIMEMLPKTLDTYCDEIKSAPLETRLDAALKMVLSCANALNENPNIRHGDIKPANMGLTESGTIKLFDFGSTHKDGEKFDGSKYFRAPEFANDCSTENTLTTPPTGIVSRVRRASNTLLRTPSKIKKYGPELDVFAMGVSAWQLLIGDKNAILQLYPNEPTSENATVDPCEINFDEEQLNRAFNHEKLNGLSEPQKNFFKSLVHPNPENRPTYVQIFANETITR